MHKTYKIISRMYVFLMFLFLYIPITILIIYSFNSGKISLIWQGFTFDWYIKLLANKSIGEALYQSLFLAVSASSFSAILGTVGAVALHKAKFRGKNAITAMAYIPVMIPEIILGISLLSVAMFFSGKTGMPLMILSHAAFCVPYVMITIMSRMETINPELEEAGQDLGATPNQTFLRVTLPQLVPAILSGTGLAFVMSMDDVIISSFTAGPENTTLPLKIYSSLKVGVTPEIYALCSLMILIPFFIIILGRITALISAISCKIKNKF